MNVELEYLLIGIAIGIAGTYTVILLLKFLFYDISSRIRKAIIDHEHDYHLEEKLKRKV